MDILGVLAILVVVEIVLACVWFKIVTTMDDALKKELQESEDKTKESLVVKTKWKFFVIGKR